MTNSAIQSNYTAGGSGVSFDLPESPAAAGQNLNFLTMALKTSRNGRSAGFPETAVTETARTQPASLEDMLRAKYPGLIYHVFDAGSSYWRTRNDYPHYLIYQENADTDFLENWTPDGPNPEYSSSAAIRALSRIPAGQTAVIIHPAVQKQMEEDPEYARVIMDRIEAWFRFDILRNEAIMPASPPEAPAAWPSARTAISSMPSPSAIRRSHFPKTKPYSWTGGRCVSSETAISGN